MLEHLGGEAEGPWFLASGRARGFVVRGTLTNGIPAPGPCQQEVLLGKSNKNRM